jgi:hypothetical protein
MVCRADRARLERRDGRRLSGRRDRDLPAPVDIGRAVVDTLSLATCPYGGVSDVDVQADVGGTWRTVATVRGNTGERIGITFPVVSASALRLHILDSTAHDFSRLVEIEAYPS